MNVVGFIEWALTHIDSATMPKDAIIPIPHEECGVEKWHYLFGTIRARTTKERIKERWDSHYSKSWSRAAYDKAVKDFGENDYATDCQGLLDAYLTYECGEKTDITANANYLAWCSDKGAISEIARDYVIGEAVFIQNSATGKMTHVGWICGFMPNGAPLVVEARGLAYGVVITKFSERPWSHRGLMTKRFSYDGAETSNRAELKPEAEFKLSSPLFEGAPYLYMQRALNRAGYTDSDGKELTEDGKWGKRSASAFEKLISKHSNTQPQKVLAFFDSAESGYSLAVIKREEQENV
ncbi:MAG: hypothetical protein IKS90_02635 [Clostridia bacterium]|nr:hypothetical protein [Clostridia bacterium]